MSFDNKTLTVISLGAGVQSSALLLMAAAGEFGKKPDCAIFADTGWEPKAVYDWMDALQPMAEAAGIAVHRVMAGNIREDTIAGRLPRASAPDSGETRLATMPFYLSTKNGKGMLRRQCTSEYKINPVRRKIRELLTGDAKSKVRIPKGACELWMGISRDEFHRQSTSNVAYIKHRFPLIEREMRRSDCQNWLIKNGYPKAPRSACVGCPYHTDAEWRNVMSDPEQRRDVIEFDASIRHLKRIDGDVYLHKALRPIAEVDFSTAEENGQQVLEGFADECEGMCGV